jgi:hypothetical protein
VGRRREIRLRSDRSIGTGWRIPKVIYSNKVLAGDRPLGGEKHEERNIEKKRKAAFSC